MIALVDSQNPAIGHCYIDLEVVYNTAGEGESRWVIKSANDELSFEIMDGDVPYGGLGPSETTFPSMPINMRMGTITPRTGHYARPYGGNMTGSNQIDVITNNDINIGDKIYYYYNDYMAQTFKFECRTIIDVQDIPYISVEPGKVLQRLIFDDVLNANFMYTNLLDIRTP